jgi:hypothetical protein
MSSQRIALSNPFLDKVFPILQGFGEHNLDYSRFGLIGHNGIDYACPEGTRAYASTPGTVTKIGYEEGGYGNYVRISTVWGRIIYAHLSRTAVQVGQKVNAGDFIGYTGNTGFSTTPHLHFEVRINGLETNGYNGAVDPAQYFVDLISGVSGGSSQPPAVDTEQTPASAENRVLGVCSLPSIARYEITYPLGVNFRSDPDVQAEDLGDLETGRKINVVVEHEENGNKWAGFVVWFSPFHSGRELARKVR